MPVDPEWQQKWPHLREDDFRETSPESGLYNCIAWAAGITERWWWPSEFSYWPRGVPRAVTLDAFAQAYGSLGFERCADSNLEEGFEKVAVYADEFHKPQHAARQLPDGRWTSKLGQGVDIEHANLTCLEGASYGRVALVLRRRHRRQAEEASHSDQTSHSSTV